MTRINLLDWRAELRERQKKQFVAYMALALLTAGAVVGIGMKTLDHEIQQQVARNDFLRKEIKEVDAKIKEIEDLEKTRGNLLARMAVIEQLQASRAATVHFFDEIVNTLPEGVHLVSVKQTGSNINIDGVAESNGRVSTYMKNLEASPWFENPRLIVIKTSEQEQLRRGDFSLTVKNLTRATKPDDEGLEGEEVVE